MSAHLNEAVSEKVVRNMIHSSKGTNRFVPPVEGSRDEYNVEVFYRFPLFPGVDTTLSYQSVINPALNPNFDHASVFSLRLRSVF